MNKVVIDTKVFQVLDHTIEKACAQCKAKCFAILTQLKEDKNYKLVLDHGNIMLEYNSMLRPGGEGRNIIRTLSNENRLHLVQLTGFEFPNDSCFRDFNFRQRKFVSAARVDDPNNPLPIFTTSSLGNTHHTLILKERYQIPICILC